MGVNGTIRVTDPSGRLLCELLVDPEATVALLKEMLQIEVRSLAPCWSPSFAHARRKTGIPVGEQRVSLSGQELSGPHRSLASYPLTSTSTLVLQRYGHHDQIGLNTTVAPFISSSIL